MKILMVYSGPYPHIGGLSTHMELIGKGLKKLNHEVDYLSYTSFPRFMQILFFGGPRYILNKLYNGLGNIYYFSTLNLILNIVLLYIIYYKKYDMINTHHISSTILAGLVKKLFKIPVILTVHTYFSYELVSDGFLKKDSYLQRLSIYNEKRAYNSASHIITVDNRLRDYILSFGILANKVDVMLNPVDTDIFTPRSNKDEYRKLFNIPQNKIVILCPRRLVKKNGVKCAVLACVHLKKKIKDFVLVCAGDGPEKTTIKELIKEYKLEDNVLLLGAVEYNKMSNLYNAADIVVISSIHIAGLEEASSISALEAMASGVPVVASNIGGLKDIIKNGFNGILIPEKNEKELADAIYEILTNREMYDSISRNSVEYVRENLSYISRAEFLITCAENLKCDS